MLSIQPPAGLGRRAPKTNLQRQREFCERNPHYYRDRHRRKKAESAAAAKLMAEHPELTLAQAHAIAQSKAPAPATPKPQPATPPVVLALPAPEDVATTTVTMTLPDAFTYQPAKIRIVTAPGSSPGEHSGNPTTSRDREGADERG